MKIIFIRSYMMNGRKQVVGQKAVVWDTKAKELIKMGVAEKYDGPMNKKVKINLENLKRNGKNKGKNLWQYPDALHG